MKEENPLQIDYIMNGKASGGIAQQLLANNFNYRALKPFIGNDGRNYITVWNERRQKAENVITNAPTSLRFQDWRLIDKDVVKVAKPELRFIGDLRSRGLDVPIANGMGVTIYSWEDMSDIGPASINMEGLVQGDSDRPVFTMHNMPLPIIHKDFQLSARQVAASRRGDTPLDTANAQMAAERVAEAAESLALGVLPNYYYGGGYVYGLANFPSRITKVLTKPGAGGWTGSTTVNEVAQMVKAANDAYHYGPFMLYASPNWKPFMDEDFSAAKGDLTLRDRIKKVEDIIDVKSIPFLQFLPGDPYSLFLVEMKPRTIREVVAMDITTLQWESHGGMQLNFKVLCIMAPQPRADQNGNCGIVHGSIAA